MNSEQTNNSNEFIFQAIEVSINKMLNNFQKPLVSRQQQVAAILFTVQPDTACNKSYGAAFIADHIFN